MFVSMFTLFVITFSDVVFWMENKYSVNSGKNVFIVGFYSGEKTNFIILLTTEFARKNNDDLFLYFVCKHYKKTIS